MINKAIQDLLKAMPDANPIGYWRIGKGVIIKIEPHEAEEGFMEELLFYVENGRVNVTNPFEHPVIVNKPMTKI